MKSINKIILIFIIASLMACSKGYDIQGDDVVFKTWNEAHGQIIKKLDADPGSFQILGSDNLHFAKDKSKVFFRGIEINYMDALKFNTLNDYFGTDGYRVTAGCKQIKNINANTTKVIKPILTPNISKSTYATDGNKIYWYIINGYCEGAKIVTNFTTSFEVLNNDFAIDQENVYYGDEIIEGAIPDSFKILNKTYTTDGINVYAEGRLLKKADAQSFRVINEFSGEDKNYKYRFSSIVETK